MSYRKTKPNYGIDAPRMGLAIALLVIAVTITGFYLRTSDNDTAKSIVGIIFSIAPTGIIILLLIILYVTVEKFPAQGQDAEHAYMERK